MNETNQFNTIDHNFDKELQIFNMKLTSLLLSIRVITILFHLIYNIDIYKSKEVPYRNQYTFLEL